METVRTETLQAQGWEKWLPSSNLLGGSNFRESLSKVDKATKSKCAGIRSVELSLNNSLMLFRCQRNFFSNDRLSLGLCFILRI
jgi:hypothetical protein